jgi:CRP-like cAMP-binding protein
MKYPELYNFVNLKTKMGDQDWPPFEQHLKFEEIIKGTIISRPDEKPSDLYFVVSGILRIYYQDKNGREFTKFFSGPNSMIGAYAELLQNQRTRSYIQTVTDAKVFKFSFQVFREMIDKFSSWKDLARIIAEENYVIKEKREYMLLQLSSEECYQMFLSDFKDIMIDIPQYQIASYLGMTPEAFNRFLKKREK